MNDLIFKRKDFALCDVPVPKCYPQSQTHSGIAFYKGKYYLTTSPYPEIRCGRWQAYLRVAIRKLSMGFFFKNGEFYENPCLYVGVPSHLEEVPVKFRPLQPFPLMSTPRPLNGFPAYNSDPDIFIDNGEVFILNRSIFRTSNQPEYLGCITKITLISGTLNDEQYVYKGKDIIKEWGKPYASPCLTKYREKYIFTYLDTNSAIDSETFNGLYLQQLNHIDELKSNTQYSKVKVICEDLLPWHMSLFQYEGILYTIIACVKKGDKTRKVWQMLGKFKEDLSELKIFPVPLTDYNSYRGAACVSADGFFILYSTTVAEKIEGSSSVDGRNIVMATMPFHDLISKLSL